MFSQAGVKNSVYKGGACVAGVGCAWPGGARVAGGVGVPGGCAWWGVHGCGHVCSGANVSMGHAWKEKMATAAGSAHPTETHFLFEKCSQWRI